MTSITIWVNIDSYEFDLLMAVPSQPLRHRKSFRLSGYHSNSVPSNAFSYPPKTTESFVLGEIYPTLATDVGKEIEEWLL
jgi:hypothetical protein